MYISTVSRTSALDGGGGQSHAPAASTPGKDPVPILEEAGWAPGPVWTGGKVSPPPGFDPGPVVSRYTDWATRPTVALYELSNVIICRV